MSPNRTALVSFAGLVLAAVAEACSVGLVGLSGWFVASSAVAGASAYSMFSYVDPSGGVRAFAVGRIGTQYAGRVVLHSAALRRISTARLRFYDRAAAAPDGRWSGESLDRVMADADTAGMAIIQATTPMMVTAATTAGGCLVIVVAGYPRTAAIVAVAAVVCAALALAAVRHADDASRTRGALRTELVTAVGAWTEMASLGAVDQLAHRSRQRLSTFESRRFHQAAAQARAAGVARAVTAATVLLVVVSSSRRGADVSTLVFLALLAAGVLGSAERLVAATHAQLASHQADQRLSRVGSDCARSAARTLTASYDRNGLTVAGYRLPDTPTRSARRVEFEIPAGHTLVVTGASGSGKTTLLNAVAVALCRPGVVSVLADDYVFTGTVADNIRLADPAASDDDVAELLASMVLDGIAPGTKIGVGGRDLSGGEQRRLHIARAVATRPEVLLVDEPTTGLDASTSTHVLAAIRRRVPHAVLLLAMHEQPPADPETLGTAWTTVSLD
jgi:ATP-binding cassette subfamily C protein CydC